MADHSLGDKVQNPKTGQVFELKDVGGKQDWIEIPGAMLDKPETNDAAGLGKAAVSGLVNQGIPNMIGAASDVKSAIGSGALATGEKLWGALGIPLPYEKKEVPGADGAPETKRIVPGVPELPANLEKNRVTSMLPSSETLKGAIDKVAPEYEPQNFGERVVKTGAEFLPSLIGAPELAAPRLATKLAAPISRVAAPAVASEAIRDLPIVHGSQYEEPAAMASALMAPLITRKIVTPNPASAENLKAASVLDKRDSTYTPGQLAGSSKAMGREGVLADAPFTGPGMKEVNTENLTNFTKGAYKDVLPPGVVMKGGATPEIRQMVADSIDKEFNRLTTNPNYKIRGGTSTPLQRSINDAVDKYEKDTTIKVSPEVRATAKEIEDAFNKRGKEMSGREYQNLRKRLSTLAFNADDADASRAYTKMRDEVDGKMRAVITNVNPDDAKSFSVVRDKHRQNAVLEKALEGQDEHAAKGLFTPEKFGAAAQRELGKKDFGLQKHPLAEYARAGQNILTPLGKEHKTEDMLRLAMVLAGGAGLGSLAGSEHAHESNPFGYVGGALAGSALTSALGALYHAPGMRGYRGNQIIPKSVRPNVITGDRAQQILFAQALAKLHERTSSKD